MRIIGTCSPKILWSLLRSGFRICYTGLLWLKDLWMNKKYFLRGVERFVLKLESKCSVSRFFGLPLKKGVMKGYVSDKI